MGRRFFREERGAMQLIEAAVIYPIVFLLIFVLIYLGLYILQSVTLGVYAQKVAMLAAREVSCQGYSQMVSTGQFSTAAVEMTIPEGSTYSVSIPTTLKDAEKRGITARPYRYWGNPLKDSQRETYEDVLKKIVAENSIIATNKSSEVKANITCRNYVLNQQIEVQVTQELAHFAVLDFFGIESPTISGSAVATVSDTDELVRTTDFAADALTALAERMGVDTKKIKEKVNSAISTLGLDKG